MLKEAGKWASRPRRLAFLPSKSKSSGQVRGGYEWVGRVTAGNECDREVAEDKRCWMRDLGPCGRVALGQFDRPAIVRRSRDEGAPRVAFTVRAWFIG